MRFHLASIALSLAAGPSTAAAQDASAEEPSQAAVPAHVTGPMASLARMATGEWRFTSESGKRQFDTWSFGPGQHSMRMRSHGTAGGELTNGVLRVVYWHPGREAIAVLGLFSDSRLAEGTLTIAGESADFVLDFYELRLPGLRRELVPRWTFDGPDAYHEALSEVIGTAGPTLLAEWDYVRFETLTPPDARTAEAAQRPSPHLENLGALVGRAWEARGEWATGEALHLQATFEWIPYTDALYARVLAPMGDGELAHLLDAYVYHHPATGTLRCLALASSGAVHEGELTVLAGGALQLDLMGYEGDRVVPFVVRLDFEEDGALRDRVWTLQGGARTLVLDARQAELGPKRD